MTAVDPRPGSTASLEAGSIPLSDVAGGVDLQATLESAQSFLWQVVDGEMYADARAHGGEDWYYTVTGGDVVFVRQRAGELAWRASTDAHGATELLRRRLRLDDDLPAIFEGFPADPPLARARRELPGLRVVNDPLFPSLISFICSARTSVAQIFEYQRTLAREFGDSVTVDGVNAHAFPGPGQLAGASEGTLRDLGFGFRAPYVAAAAERVAEEDVLESLCEEPYDVAHERLQSFHGVGPKIADCVCLFALGRLRAVPIDTWTRKLIDRYYPEISTGSYATTAAGFRDRFGAHAGYAQTYLYHYERS